MIVELPFNSNNRVTYLKFSLLYHIDSDVGIVGQVAGKSNLCFYLHFDIG